VSAGKSKKEIASPAERGDRNRPGSIHPELIFNKAVFLEQGPIFLLECHLAMVWDIGLCRPFRALILSLKLSHR
jgi:hypothetical protein